MFKKLKLLFRKWWMRMHMSVELESTLMAPYGTSDDTLEETLLYLESWIQDELLIKSPLPANLSLQWWKRNYLEVRGFSTGIVLSVNVFIKTKKEPVATMRFILSNRWPGVVEYHDPMDASKILYLPLIPLGGFDSLISAQAWLKANPHFYSSSLDHAAGEMN